ncbi:hypothetical protein E1292_01370 [Nonomuraea deserti]|uniref:CU044_5270 family protein n=1 Tax=Nonomuraea deserti TaxID=1848322 RepID=A0A4R4W9N7_9ACTN|nr:CU044_5270 family protein [Nonomuraea deserti]TDD12524.1 hypothetical protein E1292_01370 [Nonomuraea deserti]
MDDLKLVRTLRSDPPEPDADRLRSLRERSLPTGTGRAKARRRPGLRRRFWLVPSVLAAAAAAAAVVVAVNAAHDPPAGRPAIGVETVRAETVLARAAQVAERREPDGAPRPDQWLYRKVAVRQPSESANEIQEYWTRYDGTRQASRLGEFPMRVRTIEPEPDDDDLGPKAYAAKFAELPTDPDELLDHVRGDRHWIDKPKEDPGGGEHPDARAYRVLSVYLSQEVAMPPGLEAAIFRALAKIPGIRVDEGVRDAAGRAGIGIAYEPGDRHDEQGRLVERSYIVLDPTTFHYLGHRTDHLRDVMINGEVAFPEGSFYATAELAAGVVDRHGQVP